MAAHPRAIRQARKLLTYIVEENGTPCEAEFASGETVRCGEGEPRIFVKFHSDRVLLGDLSELSFGKAYLDGEWDVEGDTLNALDLRHHLQGKGDIYTKLKFGYELFLKPATRVNKSAIAAHYSFSDDFYLTFIDRKYRFYSHGIFHSDDETLETASEHKLESMYNALQLKPGMRLLDIGAGWGGVHQYCGPRGIHVTALTLAEDSYNYTDNLIKHMDLKNCFIILDDFLNHHPKEPYDAVVIYGVIEHIPYYRKFCERIWACLKPGGRLYLDAAAALQKYDVNDFARNYIWRGTHTFLCLQDIVQELLYHGMEIVEIKRETHDYELTMKNWATRLDNNKEKIVDRWGNEIYRAFRMYLWVGCNCLRANSLQAYHLVAQKHFLPGPRPKLARRTYQFMRSLV
ncbi:MAG TPA: class I SAM-dependent methyltransferase [Methylocella sp.]|jgi:cyclopropane-fatty-acyl-phospholipid synthase